MLLESKRWGWSVFPFHGGFSFRCFLFRSFPNVSQNKHLSLKQVVTMRSAASPSERGSNVRAMLHADGTGSVSLAERYQAFNNETGAAEVRQIDEFCCFQKSVVFPAFTIFSRNFEIFDFYPERFFRVGWFSSWVYVSKSSQNFRKNRKERASVHWQAMNGWIDYYSWRWNGDHPDEWIWRWMNGWMETNCFFWRHSLSEQRSMNFRRRRLHRHFLETLGYSEGKAWQFGSWGISLLHSKMDDFFNQDMFNMFNVGNSWNIVVIYTLPCTVYMSICSMNLVSSSNIRTVYRYWKFSSVRGEAHTVKMPLKSAMMITLHVK